MVQREEGRRSRCFPPSIYIYIFFSFVRARRHVLSFPSCVFRDAADERGSGKKTARKNEEKRPHYPLSLFDFFFIRFIVVSIFESCDILWEGGC